MLNWICSLGLEGWSLETESQHGAAGIIVPSVGEKT